MHDAPMDMRMNEDDMFTAATVVNDIQKLSFFELSRSTAKSAGRHA